MNRTKPVTRLCGFAVALVFTVLLMFGMCGFVGTAQAVEFAATPIATQADSGGASFSGTLKPGATVTKTFTMPKKGYVVFKVALPQGIGFTRLRVESVGTTYLDTQVANGGTYGASGSYTTSKYSFKPGAKVKVKLSLQGNLQATPVPYTVEMVAKAPAKYETERNNSRAKANALKLGALHSGNLMKSDVDWVVFKAPAAGTYRVYGKTLPLRSGLSSSATMVLYKAKKALVTKNPVSGNGAEALGTVKLKKGQKLFVKATPPVLFPLFNDSSLNYTVRVKKLK